MTRGRWILVGLVVVAAVAALAGPPALDWVRERNLCEDFKSNAEAAPDSAGGGEIRAAVIGDSWTSGWELDEPTDGFAYRLADIQGWDARIDGFANSGYVNESFCGDQRFHNRVAGVPAEAQVVVVEGGLNDVASEVDGDVRDAAERTLASVFAQAPNATVFVLGAPSATDRSADELAAVNDALETAAEAAGAVWVDTSAWQLDYLDDDLHLTEQGHQEFAELVSAELSAAP